MPGCIAAPGQDDSKVMHLQAQPLTQHVASHPEATLLVGPLFAAFTGVSFKEGAPQLL